MNFEILLVISNYSSFELPFNYRHGLVVKAKPKIYFIIKIAELNLM